MPAILIDGQGTVAWARSPQVPQNHRMSPSSFSIFILSACPKILKSTTVSHQILRYVYGVLNIDEKKLIAQLGWKLRDERFKPN